jgi:hypothetical protein
MKTITGYLVVLASLAAVLGFSVHTASAGEASSIMCDNGIVNIGDLDVDVQDKCGEPNSKIMNVWVYNFGPSEPVYTVIFSGGRVERILEDEWGS